jgi:hypothetical protein
MAIETLPIFQSLKSISPKNIDTYLSKVIQDKIINKKRDKNIIKHYLTK